MLFLFEILKGFVLDDINEKFRKKLKLWVDSFPEEKGKITKLAKSFGKTQGHFSNILEGRRGTTETWRRKVAERIGIPYDEMIEINGTSKMQLVKPKIQEHTNIIHRFQDPETGKNINENLIKLEKFNPKGYQRIIGKIEMLVELTEEEAIKKI